MMATTDVFSFDQYMLRRKIFKLFGAAFHIFDARGNVVLYSKMKAFKLKEDIRLYTGEDMKTELLVIKARSIIDIAATYDVFDSVTGAKIGALRRKGLKSIIKDEWVLMDASDREIGRVEEDIMILALLRRFVTALIPQTYHGRVGGQLVCEFKQNFNPFVLKLRMDFSMDRDKKLDRRIGIAAAILLGAIEGRQN